MKAGLFHCFLRFRKQVTNNQLSMLVVHPSRHGTVRPVTCKSHELLRTESIVCCLLYHTTRQNGTHHAEISMKNNALSISRAKHAPLKSTCVHHNGSHVTFVGNFLTTSSTSGRHYLRSYLFLRGAQFREGAMRLGIGFIIKHAQKDEDVMQSKV